MDIVIPVGYKIDRGRRVYSLLLLLGVLYKAILYRHTYLLFVWRVFFALLENMKWNGGYTDVKVPDGAVCVSHLLFTNDNYLYCKTNE